MYECRSLHKYINYSSLLKLLLTLVLFASNYIFIVLLIKIYFLLIKIIVNLGVVCIKLYIHS